MNKMYVGLSAIFLAGSVNAGSLFTGDFEDGKVNSTGSADNGFFLQALKGSSTYVPVYSGGAGPSSGLDTKVVGSAYIGGETVKPRKGSYFLESEIFYGKYYGNIAGNDGRNSPRQSIDLGHDNLHVDFDDEAYVGFSIYVPKNYVHETGVKDDRGSVVLLSTYATTQSTFFSLAQYVSGGDSQAHWWLHYYVGSQSTQESNAKQVVVDLGAVSPDVGKWTDFVIRYRANPFSQTTNPAAVGISGAMNKVFEGNKGVLQLWKSEGAENSNGDREMRLKVSRVNVPVGLVPARDSDLMTSFRVYKYGWHNNSTANKGSVWFGFDEIKHGSVVYQAASYDKVAPVGGGVSLAPVPPSSVSIR